MKKQTLFFLLICTTVINLFAQERGTFIDERDGHEYEWVKIGKQVWMAENLAYKASSGCWANGEYGYLYNFKTAKNVCPEGYHLPTKGEYNKLLKNYGGKNGDKINFDALSVNGVSGFSGLLGGIQETRGNRTDVEEVGGFWTATSCGIDCGNYLFMARNHKGDFDFGGNGWTGAGIRGYAKSVGLSVRCIKD